MAAVQAEHTLRLDRIETDVGQIKADLKGLTANLPAMLSEAVREGLKERDRGARRLKAADHRSDILSSAD